MKPATPIEETKPNNQQSKKTSSISQLIKNKKIKKLSQQQKYALHLSQPNKGKQNIPFLSDLPPRFRRPVPEISINAFVYVKKVENRLIMLNSETYHVGQEIAKNMWLKKIQKNSIVVEFKKKIFQIKR